MKTAEETLKINNIRLTKEGVIRAMKIYGEQCRKEAFGQGWKAHRIDKIDSLGKELKDSYEQYSKEHPLK